MPLAQKLTDWLATVPKPETTPFDNFPAGWMQDRELLKGIEEKILKWILEHLASKNGGIWHL